MTDESYRIREMSENTLEVLRIAEKMVQANYLKMCGVLHDREQEKEELCQRVADLEAAVEELERSNELEVVEI